MKITKRQLKRIIKEEKQRLALRDFGSNSSQQEKLNEGFKELEMEMIEDLIDLLIAGGAVQAQDPNLWQSAADYLKAAVIPQLEDDMSDDLPDPRPPGQRY